MAAELSGCRSGGLSVVVVEAATAAGVHSTGRSAAAFLPTYGGSVIRALTGASRALYDVRSEMTGIQHLRPRVLLWLASDADSASAVSDMTVSSPNLETLTDAEALQLCPPLRPERVQAVAADFSATDVDVDVLLQGYLAETRRNGGTVLLGAPVREITRDGTGWRVTAGEHVIRCEKVVNAAGAWVDDVARCAGVVPIGIQPKLRTAFVSPTAYSGDIADLPLVMDACERFYFKPEAGLVLGSSADETDSQPGDARPDEIAVAQALDSINEVTTFELRSVRRAWAGLRSFVADRLPVVGAWSAHEGFYFVAGQGGYGIQTAPALARLAADVITDGGLSGETAGYGVSVESIAPDRLL